MISWASMNFDKFLNDVIQSVEELKVFTKKVCCTFLCCVSSVSLCICQATKINYYSTIHLVSKAELKLTFNAILSCIGLVTVNKWKFCPITLAIQNGTHIDPILFYSKYLC